MNDNFSYEEATRQFLRQNTDPPHPLATYPERHHLYAQFMRLPLDTLVGMCNPGRSRAEQAQKCVAPPPSTGDSHGWSNRPLNPHY
jgi:hypothetical protein